VRGEGADVILYVDLGCPHCAATWQALGGLELRLCLRHFPIASKHRRAAALHAAAEAAGLQSEDAFWAMVDAIYADQGRQDDPHLWERAKALGLDLERFESARRSPEVEARVRRDFESGLRAGVAATPAAFTGGNRLTGANIAAELSRDRSETRPPPKAAGR
jgi:protein-disulfide isomerase